MIGCNAQVSIVEASQLVLSTNNILYCIKLLLLLVLYCSFSDRLLGWISYPSPQPLHISMLHFLTLPIICTVLEANRFIINPRFFFK